MACNWTDDDVDDRNPLDPAPQGEGMGAVVWGCGAALLTVIGAGLLLAQRVMAMIGG